MQAKVYTQAVTRAASERSRVFHMRAREYGVLNAKTRPLIEAEAREAGNHAFIDTMVEAGYDLCGCGRWVSPDYARCYVCGAMRVPKMCAAVVAVFYPEENQHMPEPCEMEAQFGSEWCSHHKNERAAIETHFAVTQA